MPSDDPGTAAEADPTRTEVYITPEVSVDDVSVGEAQGPAVFTVTLSEGSNRPVQVPWATADATSGPAATAGLDYLAASGTLTFAPGETEANVPVEILDDSLDELDETFRLVLSGPDGATLADGEAVGTILDDDPPPFLSIADAEVVEGDSGTRDAVFTVSLSAPSGLGISVDWAALPATGDHPAEAGTDYLPVSGTIAFPAGATSATVAVPVVGDRLDELDETFRVVLSNPVAAVLGDAEATGTILDDDEARITIGDVRVNEGDEATSDALFPVHLAVPADREITVAYATVPGTAHEVEDYLPVSGTLVFAAGETDVGDPRARGGRPDPRAPGGDLHGRALRRHRDHDRGPGGRGHHRRRRGLPGPQSPGQPRGRGAPLVDASRARSRATCRAGTRSKAPPGSGG